MINTGNVEDPVLKTKLKFVNHPSIKNFKDQFPNTRFSFNKIKKSDIREKITNLNSEKASQDSDITTKLIKENIDIFTDALLYAFNNYLENAIFPSIFKTTHVIPVIKKEIRSDKNNYEPASIFPNIWKIFDRCVYQEISVYF